MSGPGAKYGTMFMVMCDVNADAIPPPQLGGSAVCTGPS